MAITAKVFVTLKKGVLDPQGKAVERSLSRLGFPDAANVRVGRYIEMALEAANREEARQRVDAMCKKLLANTVIEDYRFELSE
jgi:phosphoribosylformylglycinamidine synthase subunit PurS